MYIYIYNNQCKSLNIADVATARDNNQNEIWTVNSGQRVKL